MIVSGFNFLSDFSVTVKPTKKVKITPIIKII